MTRRNWELIQRARLLSPMRPYTFRCELNKGLAMKNLSLRPLSGFLFLLVFVAAAAAQIAPVHYTVDFDPQPTTHMLHITMEVGGVKSSSVEVAFPAWSPGAYNISNGWRQVQEFSAADGTGTTLKFEKTDKQTWRISRGKDDKVTVKYNLYSTDFNEEAAYLRGPNTFMYVVGKAPYPPGGPIRLKLNPLAGWKPQTGMDSGPEPNTYQSPDHDLCMDAPILTCT